MKERADQKTSRSDKKVASRTISPRSMTFAEARKALKVKSSLKCGAFWYNCCETAVRRG